MRRNFVTKCALSQNAQKFCYEMRVVTKCAEILLRNARCYKMRRNFVTKCARCYIMRSCYKMRLNTPLVFRGYAKNTRHCRRKLEVTPLRLLTSSVYRVPLFAHSSVHTTAFSRSVHSNSCIEYLS